MPDSLITWAIVIWIIGIPIALGFTLKGQWPKTGDEFWATAIEPWLQGWFWPLALVILFCRMGLRGLWFMAVLITKGLFRFGGWFSRFLLGSQS